MMKKMILGIAVCLGINGVNGMNTMTESSRNEWIENRSSLISMACEDEEAFCKLVDAMFETCASAEEIRSLYKSVESIWGGKNVYEADINEGGYWCLEKDSPYL